MAKQWADKTDEELAQEADLGLSGQGAVVEMTRRLRDSNLVAAKATTGLAVVIYNAKKVLIGVIVMVIGTVLLRLFGLV